MTDARAFASLPADAPLRDRCRSLGIPWADAVPEASPDAVGRIAPDVAVRLRAGVIAEVGPGRPATVGSEGLRGTPSCPPRAAELACEAANP